MTTLTDLPEWKALLTDHEITQQRHLRDLFQQDSSRFDRYSLDAGGLFLDYSKNRIDDQILQHLFDLTDACELSVLREAMFSGEKINFTEQRAVLHTALRQTTDHRVSVDNENVMPAIQNELARLSAFAEKLQRGELKGYTGKPIKHLINIGIGGSHLGPMLVCEALTPYHAPDLAVTFVSGNDLQPHLASLDPATTLFIIASKTFTTQETLLNADLARAWVLDAFDDERAIAEHFVALSTNLPAIEAFGISRDRTFAFWDWVGGRYSLWSAVGLVIMLLIGPANFRDLLAGAHAMDEHFLQADHQHNMPIILGLLGVWYSGFYGAHSHAVIPYDEGLYSFPAFLQQLDMESNGKSVNKHGQDVNYKTGPVIIGSTGTDCQHAYFQSIHQGSHLIPVDFIGVLDSPHTSADFHTMLTSHCFAQSEALMRGKTADEVRAELSAMNKTPGEIALLTPHRVFPGNKPSNTILLEKLTPSALGSLIALYEHKVFVQGAIWGINSFDQWGVELGKQLAHQIIQDLDRPAPGQHDASTQGLMDRFNNTRHSS